MTIDSEVLELMDGYKVTKKWIKIAKKFCFVTIILEILISSMHVFKGYSEELVSLILSIITLACVA